MLLLYKFAISKSQAVRKAREGGRGKSHLSKLEGWMTVLETSLRISLVQPTLTSKRTYFRLKLQAQLIKELQTLLL